MRKKKEKKEKKKRYDRIAGEVTRSSEILGWIGVM